jgi:carbon monoxide dehydrogenase subunit G
MNKMTELSQQFQERTALDSVRRTNKPFYFYKKKDLDKVEKLLDNVTSPENVACAINTMQGYEKILDEYKKANKQHYPKVKGLPMKRFSTLIGRVTLNMIKESPSSNKLTPKQKPKQK